MINNECIFCKIVAKKEYAAILYEDEEILSFIDIRPVNEGHTLIIPKKHVQYVNELDLETYQKLFPIAYKISKRIKEVFPETTAFNFLIADGVDAGQEIPHVHLHVIPRKPKDGFGFKLPRGFLLRRLSEKARAEVRDKLLPI